MFKVKIKGKNEILHYTVYHTRTRTETAAYRHNPDITMIEFLIYDSKNGFHWINANFCEPV
jgi:hypothetical protein